MIALTAALAASVLTVVATATPASAVPSTDLVISQVYGGGGNTGAPWNADFVELFNRGSAPAPLGELTVQYGSAAGTVGTSGLLVALPAVDVPAGGRFLIGMSAGTTGLPLPTPNQPGSIAMAAGSGKVALVTGDEPLGCASVATCAPTQLDRVVDLVGYGTASFFEGAAAAPSLSATVAAHRAAGGCTDTDVNRDDFTVTAPAPGTSASPVTPCGGNAAPTITTDPFPILHPTGTTASYQLVVADDVTIADVIVDEPLPIGVTIDTGTDGPSRTITITIADTAPAGAADLVLTLVDDVGATTTFTGPVEVLAVSPISAVQGSTATSPLVDGGARVEGIVTSTFTTNDALSGFFVQEEDADADGDPGTSEGVFVDCAGACPPGLTAGALVDAVGVVLEDFGMTQIRAVVDGQVTIVSTGNEPPTATKITLPAAGRTDVGTTFEAIEGMSTTVVSTLAVTEFFELAQFGQLELIAGDRPYQFTHEATPSVPGYSAHLAEQATRRIILDDDNDDRNDAVTGVPDEPYPYPSPGLSTAHRFRGGDTITGLSGVLEWSFGAWRLRPIPGADDTFQSANPVPPPPVDLGGDLRIGSFNVLNYFTTLDDTTTGAPPCGPTGGLDCRGANSPAELAQQRAKIVAALAALDADVVGLVELQNDGGAAVDDLVTALNAVSSDHPYEFVDTGTIGTDAIKVAFIYRPSVVTPIGPYEVFDSVDDPRFIDTRNRPALIQTFAENATGERFTAVINHFKSKGSACTSTNPAVLHDPDLGDGQGNCNRTRTQAAEALAHELATDPRWTADPDVVILGDLNSYRREDPITTLIGAGYTDLVEEFTQDAGYSYLFDGQLGYLDHALASESMAGQVTGLAEWHVNADEPVLFDYNDDVRDDVEEPFERESAATELDAADARRSSDHDPVVFGLDPTSLHVDAAVIAQRSRGGGTLVLSAHVDGTYSACPSIALTVEGVPVVSGPTVPLSGTTCLSVTSAGLLTFDTSTGAVAAALTLPATFRLTDDTVTFGLTTGTTSHVEDRLGRRIGAIWTT
ncbi:MAG: ExeM/NucH family extracellular endonuclease [Ilumatobacteraceae bacterium]